MDDRYSFEEIWYLDTGTFTLDDPDLRRITSEALSLIPSDVVESLMNNCFFLLSRNEEKGLFFPRGFFRGAGLVVFPSALLEWGGEDQIRTVLHEVAHFALDHINPLDFDPDGDAEELYDNQEREANELVERWLSAN